MCSNLEEGGGGTTHIGSEGKCEILANQFTSVFTENCDDPYSDTDLHGPSYPPFSKLIIKEGVHKLLEDINPNKACGPDQVPCKVLKELATELAPVSTFFQQLLHTGDMPTAWLTAWIAHIFKKGPWSEPENYRPVSLTYIACKLFEHIIWSHVRSHPLQSWVLE